MAEGTYVQPLEAPAETQSASQLSVVEAALRVDKTRRALAMLPTLIRQLHGAIQTSSGPARVRALLQAIEAFQRAIETGDIQGLLDQLAPDVVFLGDGGGIKQAALQPIVGADSVAALLASSLPRIGREMTVEPAQINGYPALILRLDGEVDTIMAVRVDDTRITGLYSVRNPEKLSRATHQTLLAR